MKSNSPKRRTILHHNFVAVNNLDWNLVTDLTLLINGFIVHSIDDENIIYYRQSEDTTDDLFQIHSHLASGAAASASGQSA